MREVAFSNNIVIICDRGLDIYRPPNRDGVRQCRNATILVFENSGAGGAQPGRRGGAACDECPDEEEEQAYAHSVAHSVGQHDLLHFLKTLLQVSDSQTRFWHAILGKKCHAQIRGRPDERGGHLTSFW